MKVWLKTEYTWTIETISKHLKMGVGYELTSPAFTIKSEEDYEWSIVLYPLGQTEDTWDYLDVYLDLQSLENRTVTAKFTLSIRDSEDNVIVAKNTTALFNGDNYEGFSKLIKRTELLGHVRDDTVKIRAEVLAMLYEFSKGYEVGFEGHEFKLLVEIGTLFDTAKYSDAMIHVEDVKFPVHRCILAARSPVFTAMFDHTSIEKDLGIIEICDFGADVFQLFLQFVYTNKVNIPDVDTAIQLLEAGDKYIFSDLVSVCVSYLTTNLNVANSNQILLLADSRAIDKLKNKTMKYIFDNIRYFSDIKKFQIIESQRPRLLSELMVRLSTNYNLVSFYNRES